MCLAKAYVIPAAGATDPGGRLLMENVTLVQVDDDRIRLRSLLGETAALTGRIASIDFSEGRLTLESNEG